MRQFFTGTGLFVVMFCSVAASLALPRFALMTGTKCQSCHVNPTGGGMRTEYGMAFSSDKLPLEAMRDSDFTFSGKLNDHISIGGDHRGQFIYDKGSASTSFQAMTTSIYGSVQVNKKYYFYFKQDLVNPGYSQGAGQFPGPEVFALAKLFPGMYVKGGVFMPNFGWRLDDHTSYTRGGDIGYVNGSFYNEGLIFVPNYKDVGIEVGGNIGGLVLTGGLFNGDGNQYQIHLSNQKAYALKAEYYGSLADLNFNLGVSAYGYSAMTMQGVTGGIGIGDVTLLGEVDVTNNYITGASAVDSLNPGGNTMAAHIEGDYRMIQGIWLIGMYDIFDPIQGIASTDVKRITAGLEFFPFSFVEIRPQYRHLTKADPSVSDDQLLVQMHLWF